MTGNITLPCGIRASRGRGPFIYADYADNHVIWPGRKGALKRFVEQTYGGMRHKVRHSHSSNSEDALTWSCFDTLRQLDNHRRRRALSELWQLAFNGATIPPPVAGGEIKIGQVYDAGERTEVDVSIEGDGVLVFIEAKLYSPMSQSDTKRKRHNQIARKLRAGALVARERKAMFFFILLDLAPMEVLSQMHPRASAEEARKAKASGFGAKWLTSWWFSYYKYGRNGSRSPLSTILEDTLAVGIDGKQIAENMGWLTWADVFKTVLRAAIMDRPSVIRRRTLS
jgi:hypothetical protein